MQHVFSLGSVFRVSPFVNYHHQMSDGQPALTPIPDAPKDPAPPAPPPPPQKLLIKLRVADLGKKPDEQEPTQTKRRGGGSGSRGKRRKVDAAPTDDDSTAGDDSSAPKRGRGKGSRGGGRGRGARKSGLQHHVLAGSIPGTPDSVGELSLRPVSPASESTSNLTPTPISTPVHPISQPAFPLPPSSLSIPQPSELDQALLSTAPRRPLPTRAFPVQPAPKTAPAVPNGPSIDSNRRPVRKWGVKMREVKGVGGGSWWVRTWVGSPESEYASDPSRVVPAPTPARAPKPRKSNSTLSIKQEPPSFGSSHYRDRDQEGVELLTAFASSSSRKDDSWGGLGAKHYRDRAAYWDRAGESSGTSTPNAPVYDLAKDGIEEVPPPGKGKGREVNGKGKEKEAYDVVVKQEQTVERGLEDRARSATAFEQAARDVEMELMGER